MVIKGVWFGVWLFLGEHLLATGYGVCIVGIIVALGIDLFKTGCIAMQAGELNGSPPQFSGAQSLTPPKRGPYEIIVAR